MEAPLIITIVLMTLIVAITAGLWARHRGARPLMGGIGVLLIPLGLFLMGLTALAYNGVVSIIDWAGRTVWAPIMTWGASLAGAGLLLFIISRFIKPAGPVVTEPSQGTAVAPRPRANTPAVSTGPAAGASASKPAAKTAEDAEVEDILRKRGLL